MVGEEVAIFSHYTRNELVNDCHLHVCVYTRIFVSGSVSVSCPFFKASTLNEYAMSGEPQVLSDNAVGSTLSIRVVSTSVGPQRQTESMVGFPQTWGLDDLKDETKSHDLIYRIFLTSCRVHIEQN